MRSRHVLIHETFDASFYLFFFKHTVKMIQMLWLDYAGHWLLSTTRIIMRCIKLGYILCYCSRSLPWTCIDCMRTAGQMLCFQNHHIFSDWQPWPLIVSLNWNIFWLPINVLNYTFSDAHSFDSQIGNSLYSNHKCMTINNYRNDFE